MYEGCIKVLKKSLENFHEKLQVFGIILMGNYENLGGVVNEVFETIAKMEALKELELDFVGTIITENAYRTFGEDILPKLKSLDALVFRTNSDLTTEQGSLPILRNLPKLKKWHLSLILKDIQDKDLKTYFEEVISKLDPSGKFTFLFEKQKFVDESLQEMRKYVNLLKRKLAPKKKNGKNKKELS